MKNPIWVTEDGNYLMLCNDDVICTLDKKAYDIILNFEKEQDIKITWSMTGNGYINGNPLKLYMHQVVANLYGQGTGKDKLTVDHIDRNPLNNRSDNLRHATYDEQKENNKQDKDGIKRKENSTAKHRAKGIGRQEIPKYVYYGWEVYGDHGAYREFYIIDNHPKLEKVWSSSKSNKISIRDKLDQAKAKLYRLDNDIESDEEDKLPVGIMITTAKSGIRNMVFDRRIKENGGNKRFNLKSVFNKTLTDEENIELFKEKIKIKYPDYDIV